MSDSVLVQDISPNLATLQLNRPRKRNALSIEMLDRLYDIVAGLTEQSTMRVLILHGAGPVFCAGLDLDEASISERVQHSAESLQRLLRLLRETRLVTIVAAHGGAYAGGAGLLAACDIAIGAEDLKIACPEARRGLIPALICDVMKTKVREGDLRELFLSGQAMDAVRSQQIGLLQRIVPVDELLPEARQLAKDVLAGGPRTVEATKELIRRAYLPSTSNQENSTLERHVQARFSEEAREGMRAFLEKRSPSWVQEH